MTLPAEARKDMGIHGETQFQVEVIPGGLILREAVTIPVDDAWAYTPEALDQARRSREDVKHGRVVQLSMAELEKLIEDAE